MIKFEWDVVECLEAGVELEPNRRITITKSFTPEAAWSLVPYANALDVPWDDEGCDSDDFVAAVGTEVVAAITQRVIPADPATGRKEGIGNDIAEVWHV